MKRFCACALIVFLMSGEAWGNVAPAPRPPVPAPNPTNPEPPAPAPGPNPAPAPTDPKSPPIKGASLAASEEAIVAEQPTPLGTIFAGVALALGVITVPFVARRRGKA